MGKIANSEKRVQTPASKSDSVNKGAMFLSMGVITSILAYNFRNNYI